MFEGITCVYKSNVDLFFYVFGASSENELILSSVLSAFYDAIGITLKENIEKAALYEHLGDVMLILDELVDGGFVLMTHYFRFLRARPLHSTVNAVLPYTDHLFVNTPQDHYGN